MNLNRGVKGPNYCKINDSILAQEDYRKLIKNFISEYNTKSINHTNIDILRDKFTIKVRELTIDYCKTNAKLKRDKIKTLENKMKELHIQAVLSTCNLIVLNNNIKEIEYQLTNLYSDRIHGQLIR